MRKKGKIAKRGLHGKDAGASTSSPSNEDVIKTMARNIITATVKWVANPADKKALAAEWRPRQ